MANVDDPAELAAFVRGHSATDAEVKLLCKDLQVGLPCWLGWLQARRHQGCMYGCLSFPAVRYPDSHPTCLPLPQVLGRSEFKHLLRWRLMVKKDLKQQQKEAAKAAAAEEEGGSADEVEEEDPEEKLLREMTEIKDT